MSSHSREDVAVHFQWSRRAAECTGPAFQRFLFPSGHASPEALVPTPRVLHGQFVGGSENVRVSGQNDLPVHAANPRHVLHVRHAHGEVPPDGQVLFKLVTHFDGSWNVCGHGGQNDLQRVCGEPFQFRAKLGRLTVNPDFRFVSRSPLRQVQREGAFQHVALDALAVEFHGIRHGGEQEDRTVLSHRAGQPRLEPETVDGLDVGRDGGFDFQSQRDVILRRGGAAHQVRCRAVLFRLPNLIGEQGVVHAGFSQFRPRQVLGERAERQDLNGCVHVDFQQILNELNLHRQCQAKVHGRVSFPFGSFHGQAVTQFHGERADVLARQEDVQCHQA